MSHTGSNQSSLELLCSFAVESAGGKFLRVERTVDGEGKPITLVVFLSPATLTKLKLPILELTYDRVKKSISEVDQDVPIAAVLA